MSEGPELKAGHPPAVKAGGMRIVTKHKHKEQDADAFDEKYKDSVNPIGGPPVKVDIKQDVVAPATLESAHTQNMAVKAYHEKPKPKHEKTHSPTKPMQINQPRK